MLQRLKSARSADQLRREEAFLKLFHLGTRRFSHQLLGWGNAKGKPYQNPERGQVIVFRTDDGARYPILIAELT